MKSIEQIQDEIIENFSLFENDKESALFYLMDLGKKLAPMPEAYKIDDYRIKGCMSSVWVYPTYVDGKINLQADSNTDITRGLIALLVSIWNKRSPQEVLQNELYFINKIGMSNMLGSQRSNGLASMIQQIKQYAYAYQLSNSENSDGK